MTMRSEALRSAEQLATLLQQARGTSSARWRWERDESSLALHPHTGTRDGALPWRDLLDCGEVLHLVRTAAMDGGWHVATTLRGDQGDDVVAALEIVDERGPDHDDDLYSATRVNLSDTELDTAPVDVPTAMILLRDAAVEHGTLLVPVDDALAARIPAQEMASTTWRTVAPGYGSKDQRAVALLSTVDDSVAAHLRAGMASADIQLTAATISLDAVPLTEQEAGELSPSVATGECMQVAFRFEHPRGSRQSRSAASGTYVHAPARIPLQAAAGQRVPHIQELATARHRR